jgi:metallo-beta-lactamase class B
MRYIFLAPFAAASLVSTTSPAQNAQQRVEWNRPAEPFRIVGNVYYVGTRGLAAYLVTGAKGHVLIDGGLPDSAPLIAGNIRRLGFKLSDIEYLLINHGHFDHSGGLSELKRLTGAKLIALAAERADLEAGRTIGRPELDRFPPVKVDRVIGDGARFTLGNIKLTAHWTPGHTRGCTSWSTKAGKQEVLFACSLTVAGQNLIGDKAYPSAAQDFEKTFAKLRQMTADVFLNFHPEFFDLEGKRARQLNGDPNAFVDPGELSRQTARAEEAYRRELRRQRGQ